MTIGDKIVQRRKEIGLSQGKLWRKLGWKQSRLSHYEIGKRTPGPDEIRELATALETNEQYFFEDGYSLHQSRSSANLQSLGFPPALEVVKIPIISWDKILIWINGDLNMDEVKEWTYTTDTSLAHCIALIIQNDEMTTSNPSESYARGEIIIVDLKEKHKTNDFVIARIKSSSEILFKQYIKYADKYYLKSLNPQYPLIDFTDNMEIIGVVMEVHNVRKNRR